MPYINYSRNPVRVNMPDTTVDNTVVKRKAVIMNITQHFLDRVIDPISITSPGSPNILLLTVKIEHYGVGPVVNGQTTYGQRLSNKFRSIDYLEEIVIDNSSLVDSTNGDYLGPTDQYLEVLRQRQATGNQNIPLPSYLYEIDGITEKSFMTEDTFFRKIADNNQTILTNFQRAIVVSAINSGKIS